MKQIKKRVKRLLHNFKTIKWAKPKDVLKGVGSAVAFTTFFIVLFLAIDFIGSFVAELF